MKDKKADIEKAKEQRRVELAKIYADLVKQDKFFPTRSDLLSKGISRDQIRHYFGTIANLRDTSKALFPKAFSGVISIDEVTSPEYLSKLDRLTKKYKRFVITTAVNGQSVHKGFLASIETFCEENDAALLLIPCHDPAHNLDNGIEWHFDKSLVNHTFVYEKLQFNSNIHISPIRVTAKQTNPTTGLGRFAQSEGSAIFGSPKQSLEFIPVSNIKYPHALMSTGAITHSNYATTRGNSMRTAFIAEHDHVIGGVILEIADDNRYHFRQIQADPTYGCFADLGKLYTAKSVKNYAPQSMKIGDYHAGEHDTSAEKAWLEVVDATGVNEVILEDLHNGASTSHHDEGKIVTLAKKARSGQLDLIKELQITGAVLNTWTKKVDQVIVTASNHNEFLTRWVEQGRFGKDPLNFQVGCKLADKMIDGIDPVVYGVELYGNVNSPDKIRWLQRDEDYKIAGIELGAHGDLGPNGAKGSKVALEKAYGKCVIAHSHTPGILRGVFQVGTTSLLKLDYNRGPSSWVHCSCLIYENGQRQLIISIDGKWRL